MPQNIKISVADPGGYLLYPWIPPFGLATYNRSVFSTDYHDLLKPPLPAKWIQKAMEQLTYKYCDRILPSSATSNSELAIFDRKWASSAYISATFFDTYIPFLQTWICHWISQQLFNVYTSIYFDN